MPDNLKEEMLRFADEPEPDLKDQVLRDLQAEGPPGQAGAALEQAAAAPPRNLASVEGVAPALNAPTLSPFNPTARTASDMDALLRSANIDTPRPGSRYEQLRDQDAAQATARFLGGLGIQDVAYPGANEDRAAVYHHIRALTTIRNSGLYGNERLPVSAGVVRQTLAANVLLMRDQLTHPEHVTGAPALEARLAEKEALAKKIGGLPDLVLDGVVKLALNDSRGQARSNFEDAITPELAEGQIVTGLGQAAVLADRLARSSVLPRDVMDMVQSVLGPDGSRAIADNFDQAKASYLVAKLGVIPGTQPGYSLNGTDFVQATAGPQLQRLLDARANTMDKNATRAALRLVPRLDQAYTEMEVRGDFAGRDALLHAASVAALTAEAQTIGATATATGENTVAEAEKGVATRFSDSVVRLVGAVMEPANQLAASLRTRESEFEAAIARKMVRFVTADDSLAASSQSVFDGMVAVSKYLSATGKYLDLVGGGFGTVGPSPLERSLGRKLTPGEARGLLELTPGFTALYHANNIPNMERGQRERLLELDEAARGHGPGGLATVANVFGVLGYAVVKPTMDTVTGIADDPSQAPGMYLMGKATHAGQSALAAYTRGVFTKALLTHQLRQVAAAYPEQVEVFRAAADAAVRAAPPEQRLYKMEQAAGTLQTMVNEYKKSGTVRNGSAFATTVAGVWEDMRAHAGVAGHLLATKYTAPNILEVIDGGIQRLLGRQGRPDAGLVRAIDGAKTTDPTVTALRAAVGAGAAGREWSNRIQNFHEENGRWPTAAEARPLAPDTVVNAHALVMAAEKAAPNQVHSLFNTIGHLFSRTRVADRLLTLTEAARTTIERGVQTAIDVTVKRHQWATGARPALLATVDAVTHTLEARHSGLDLAHTFLGQKELLETGRVGAESELIGWQKQEVTDRLTQVQNLRRAVLNHDPLKDFRIPRDHALWSELSVDVAQSLVATNAGKWGALTAADFYKELRRPASTTERLASVKAENDARAELQTARAYRDEVLRDPTGNDVDLQMMRERVAGLEAKRVEVARGPLPYDPALETELAGLKAAAETRAKNLLSGEAQPTALPEAEGATLLADHHYAKTRAATEETLRGVVVERQPVLKSLARFRKQMDHAGDADAATTAAGLERQAFQVTNLARAGIRTNPYLLARMPHQQLAGLTHELTTALMAETTSKSLRTQELVRLKQKFTPAEVAAWDRALDASRPPVELMERYPGVARYFNSLGVGSAQKLVRPEALWKEMIENYTDLMAYMKQSGFMPDVLVDTLKKMEYDPERAGLYARPRLIGRRNVFGKRIEAEGTTGGTGGAAFGTPMDKTEFMFNRDPERWRVRVPQKDRVVDRLFDTRDEALGFIRTEYGQSTVEKLKEGETGLTGRTPYKEPITIGSPVNAEAKAVLDNALGTKTELQLVAQARAWKDVSLHALASALNVFGNKILDDRGWAQLGLHDSGEVRAQFTKMPDNPTKWGDLSGKYVHTDILRELNHASSHYDAIKAAMEGLEEAGRTGFMPKGAAGAVIRAAGAVTDQLTHLASNSLIVYNWSTHVSQVFMPLVSDMLAGTGVFTTADGWAAVGEAWRQLNGSAAEKSPLFHEAREGNLIHGMVPTEHQGLRRIELDIFGLTDKSLETKLAARKALLQRRQESVLAGEVERTAELSKDVAAMEAGLHEMSMGRLKKFVRAALGTFFKVENTFGLPASGLNQWARRALNRIDEVWKLAQFTQLRRRLPLDVAIEQVKRYSQNYAETPQWLRQIPKPLRSMVVSFPYEAARIGINALLYAPQRLLGLYAAVAAHNFHNMTVAGISGNRYSALVAAHTDGDDLHKSLFFLHNLLITNKDTGNIDSMIPMGRILPWDQTFKGSGVVRQLYDNLIPPEKRNWLGSVGGAAAGLASNFVGSNPILNMTGALVVGVDPYTGAKLFDASDSVWQRTVGALRVLGNNLIPPALPQAAQIVDEVAHGTAISTTTGKRYQSEHPATLAMRALTGIGIKGKLADQFWDTFGVGRLPEQSAYSDDRTLVARLVHQGQSMPYTGEPYEAAPLDSKHAEIRKAYLRSVTEANSPEQRAAAQAQLDKLQREEVEAVIGDVIQGVTQSERERRHELWNLQSRGLEPSLARLPIHVQTQVLIAAAQGGVKSALLRDLVTATTYTESGRLRASNDPEHVRLATEALTRYRGQVNYRTELTPLYDLLRNYAAPQAEAAWFIEQQAHPVRVQQRQAVQETLK